MHSALAGVRMWARGDLTPVYIHGGEVVSPPPPTAKPNSIPLENFGDGDTPAIHIPYTKDHVKGSPEVSDEEISDESVEQLYAHYGLEPPASYLETIPMGGHVVESYLPTLEEQIVAAMREEHPRGGGPMPAEEGFAEVEERVENERK
jgi:hypothetical protein